MTHERLEAVSALMDGEDQGEGARIIGELARDESLRRTWGRYHLISECLRRALPRHLDPALAARIAAAVRNEPTVLAPRPGLRAAVLKPLAGLAVAASVAALALIGMHLNRGGDMPQAQPLAAAQTPTGASPGSFTFASGHPGAQPARPQLAGGQGSARLNRYLVNYNEYRGGAAIQGMFPYVRIVAHDHNE